MATSVGKSLDSGQLNTLVVAKLSSNANNSGFETEINSELNKLGSSETAFQALSDKEYFEDRFRFSQMWVGNQFNLETSQNLTRLKAALSGYVNPGLTPIGTYAFDLNNKGVIESPGALQGRSITGGSSLPYSTEALKQALQNADTDNDNLVSSQELMARLSNLDLQIQARVNSDGAKQERQEQYLLSSIQSTLAVVKPDQFIQSNENEYDGLTLKIFNTEASMRANPATDTIVQSKTYSLKELRGLVDTLQNADIDKNGVISFKELTAYQEGLKSKREAISKMANDKLIMDAISTQRVAMSRDKLLSKIDGQLKQIDDLLQTDRHGVSNFTKLSDAFQNSEGLDLGKMVAAIEADCSISMPLLA